MNFLQLCQRVRQEAGISGNGPSTTVGQSGEMKRVVDWVNTAWLDVQNAAPDWLWLRSGFSFTCTPSDPSYSATDAGISDFGSWNIEHVRVYKDTAANEYTLTYLPYDQFRHIYMRGVIPTGKPTYFTVTPDKALRVYPTPNDTYTIHGDYYKNPSELSGDTDTPEIPDRFHMLIVYGAMKKYARYEAAAEVFEDANIEYRRLMSNLMQDQLAEIPVPEPLA